MLCFCRRDNVLNLYSSVCLLFYFFSWFVGILRVIKILLIRDYKFHERREDERAVKSGQRRKNVLRPSGHEDQLGLLSRVYCVARDFSYHK